MSRIEKKLEREASKNKFKPRMRMIFLIVMAMNVAICILIVDNCAKNMLGQENYTLSNFINQNKPNIEESTSMITSYFENFIRELKNKLEK